MADTSLFTQFQNPSAEFRTAPLWVWNDDLDVRHVRAQLRSFKRAGMGGAFVHPRPGLISEYFGPQWWECFSAALSEAKKLGMKLQIYDENSYPSGFAGGHVPSQHPHTVARGIMMQRVGEADAHQPAPLATATFEGEKYEFRATEASAMMWMGGFAYVDLLRPETTQAFLEITYDEYHRRFGSEFGKTITMAFTDEPMISNGVSFGNGKSLPYSTFLAAQFHNIKGYTLQSVIPKLFLDLPGYQKARYDYYDVLHTLFVNNWAKPIQAWCRRHGIANTGHYLEHTWLKPYESGTPDAMAMYEWMDAPGIDMLEARLGRGDGKKTINVPEHVHLVTARELLSAVNQLGQKRAVCETYGAGGYDSTFEDYKRMGDWLYVHGVNYQNQHLSYMTVRGARKRDHPQTFSEHSSWWEQYRGLADYFGRLSAILSQGRMRQRILLLNPTTTGWLQANPATSSDRIKGLYESFPQLVADLSARFWDFDLGDEFILDHHGKLKGRQLDVGRQRYDVVIIPGEMQNLRQATLAMLEAFTQGGGTIIAMGKPPSHLEGVPSKRIRDVAQRWIRASGIEQLDRLLADKLGRQVDIRITPANAHHIAVMRRELDDHSVGYFVVNTSTRRVQMEMSFKEQGQIERWDAISGERQWLADEDGKVSLDLNHCESALLVIDSAGKPPTKPKAASWSTHRGDATTAVLKPLAIHPSASNVLVLDYCDLQLGDTTTKRVHHMQANMAISQAHGFDRPVWDSAVQFKRNLLDQDHFPKESGFEAEFYFDVAHRPDSIELAVECADLYQFEVNGQTVSFAGAKPWLDRHIRSIPITDLVTKGSNCVRVIAHPFKIRMELEPIYLRGNFSLTPARRGFTISPPRELSLGSWRNQGRPFYSDSVRYEFEFLADQTRDRRILRLPDWAGSVAAVRLNGKAVGMIGWPTALSEQGGYEIELTGLVRRGSNTLSVEVFGTPKNLLGPYHCYNQKVQGDSTKQNAPPRRVAWPAFWRNAPQSGPPAGELYDGVDYGLFAMPELIEYHADGAGPAPSSGRGRQRASVKP